MSNHMRLSTTLLLLGLAGAIACGQGGREEPDTAGGGPPPDKCADFNGDGTGKVRGNLRGKVQQARSVVARIRGVQANGKSHKNVLLIPMCNVRNLDRATLIEGRFVGLLSGRGLKDMKLSDTPNDVVAWWVYGDTTAKTPSGADTTIWHSQFLSLRGRDTVPKNDTLIVCGPGKGHDKDAVDWHAGACPAVADSATAGGADTVTIRPGDKPWFGCKLGCCISAMNIS